MSDFTVLRMELFAVGRASGIPYSQLRSLSGVAAQWDEVGEFSLEAKLGFIRAGVSVEDSHRYVLLSDTELAAMLALSAVDRPTPVYADYENAVERWSVGEVSVKA